MSFNRHLLIGTILVTSGFLSACAQTGDSVITRSWQVEYSLSDRADECRYKAISSDLATELRADAARADMLKRLNDLCPDMTIAFMQQGADGPFKTAFSEAKVSGDDSLQESSGPGPDAPGTSSNGDAGGGTSGQTGGSTGGDSDGGTGGDTGGNTGGDTGGDSDAGGDSKGGKGHGSNANNGGGNGSEGSSPGHGKGANQDE